MSANLTAEKKTVIPQPSNCIVDLYSAQYLHALLQAQYVPSDCTSTAPALKLLTFLTEIPTLFSLSLYLCCKKY